MYGDLIWSVPNEDSEGYVVDQDTNKVLGVDGENSFGSKVMLQSKENPESLDQKWKRVTLVTPDEEEYFTLKNLRNGLFLNTVQVGWEYVYPTIESTS